MIVQGLLFPRRQGS